MGEGGSRDCPRGLPCAHACVTPALSSPLSSPLKDRFSLRPSACSFSVTGPAGTGWTDRGGLLVACLQLSSGRGFLMPQWLTPLAVLTVCAFGKLPCLGLRGILACCRLSTQLQFPVPFSSNPRLGTHWYYQCHVRCTVPSARMAGPLDLRWMAYRRGFSGGRPAGSLQPHHEGAPARTAPGKNS